MQLIQLRIRDRRAARLRRPLPQFVRSSTPSPPQCPYGLYAEQLSGSAFTAPRARNSRSWLYRIRPAVVHAPFAAGPPSPHLVPSFSFTPVDPNQLRWMPPPLPAAGTGCSFIAGLRTVAGAGEATARSGLAIYTYTADSSMGNEAFYNADGDVLIVPQVGPLSIQTELGNLFVSPNEIVVIPRGIRFRVGLHGPSRGYMLEVYEGHFALPDLGPIGANGLANVRDFLYPVAAFEDVEAPFTITAKFGGALFSAQQEHSPFDVVAWHGNVSGRAAVSTRIARSLRPHLTPTRPQYAPYKYDLSKFNTMNTVSFDHADPSIFTVLTVASPVPGTALCDFVIFPPRWMVAERTFRPPYYHRNCMSEFMGMVWGKYDAKAGFVPGGASLHSPMTAHGPDEATFMRASNGPPGTPDKFDAGLAFMFESYLTLRVTEYALSAEHRDRAYHMCWAGLPRTFSPASVESSGPLVPRSRAEAAVEGGVAGAGEETLKGTARGSVRGDGTSAALTRAK
jgi:homogentisate 1,2-dioxygenase